MSTQPTLEACANCGRSIGKLETPRVWQNEVVCFECHKRLSDQGRGPAPDPVSYSAPSTPASRAYASTEPAYAPASPRPRQPMAGESICPNPNCGYVGTPTKKARGSGVIFIILLLLWVVPGLIYWAVAGGYQYCCPRCGLKWRDELM